MRFHERLIRRAKTGGGMAVGLVTLLGALALSIIIPSIILGVVLRIAMFVAGR